MSIGFEAVTKSYPSEKGQHPVFSNLTFTVDSGEFFCIIGPSGSGKTTLLNLLGGFDKPDSGKITFRGTAVKKPTREIATVFQDFNQLLPWKTVAGNVSLPFLGKVREERPPRGDISIHVRELLRQMGLENCENYYPHQLSGGMKQRTAIARALAAEPSVLCLDEPFGSVDAVTRNRLQELVLSLWAEKGVTVIFVTHDIKEALILADRILFLEPAGGGAVFLDNTLPRPRDTLARDFLDMAHSLFDRMERL